jgi:hypothetical protein
VSHACDHDIDLDDYGCEQCDADVTLTPDPAHDGIYWLKVMHVAGCPFLARVRAARWN